MPRSNSNEDGNARVTGFYLHHGRPYEPIDVRSDHLAQHWVFHSLSFPVGACLPGGLSLCAVRHGRDTSTRPPVNPCRTPLAKPNATPPVKASNAESDQGRRWAVVATIVLASSTASQAAAQQSQALIPGGPYTIGCSPGDEQCDADEGPKRGITVQIDAFRIDRHETSVAEYRRCVEAGVCRHPFTYRRSHYCNYDAPGRDHYPVNCVNWSQAYAFCRWREGRLAHEAEWEVAARAGSPWAQPWGPNPATCDEAVMDPGEPGQADYVTDGCWRDLSWPRGQFPPNLWGLYDVIGGVSEWVMNWYHEGAYREHYAKGDLAGPQSGSKKVIKGGAWDERAWAQRVSNRFSKPKRGNPDLYGSNGIRCVFPLSE